MSENKLSPDGPVSISFNPGGGSAPAPGLAAASLPSELPIMPVKDMAIFPRMVLPMVVSEGRHMKLVDQALGTRRVLGLVATRDHTRGDKITSIDDIHRVGVAVAVLKMARDDDGSMRLIIQGLTRFRVDELTQTEPFIVGRVEGLRDIVADDLESRALVANLRGLFIRVLDLAPHLPEELRGLAEGIDDPGALCDMIATTINLKPDERQTVVEAVEVNERLRLITALVNREIQVLELGSKIQSQVKEGLDKTQREFYLRQQLKAIKDELGEGAEAEESEVDDLRHKLEEKDLPEHVRTEAERELKRMSQMQPSSSEYHVIQTYLDWIVNLPWNEASEDTLDIAEARKVLEADHYDLDKVKKRILEYLAVRKLNPEMKGPILCFVGPPGVGKTSLGRSIARSMGREFVRLSLGGVRDEAEIRGHRRTYVGAMPGRIIQSLRRTGTRNPVFMLDEVDKLGNDFRGDPSSALLEVLDPEQNFSFSDHYLDLAFDLSKVMFVTTANVLDTIPAPLRDRMEIIELPGYTAEDKLKIAKRYLLPRQRTEHGLSSKQLTINDAAIRLLIEGYTREAGLRNLEREIGSLCRHGARLIAEGEAGKVNITAKTVPDILGPRKITLDLAMRTAVPGVATGMAWTPFGGDILFVEATSMPGKGGLTLTGQLGDVMKESAQAAVSYARSKADKLGISTEALMKSDLHIHVPAGAIPKDGPSAGVTIFTALLSLLTDRTVKPDVSMTGEITLRGHVLPVGGIKEKVLAAQRAGIKTIILPAKNERDLEEVPDNVKKGLKFVFAATVDEVAGAALAPAAKAGKPPAKKKAGPKAKAPAKKKAKPKAKAPAKKKPKAKAGAAAKMAKAAKSKA